MKVLVGLAFLITTLAHAETPPIAPQRPDGTPNRAVWMAAGRIGVMVHYLPTPDGVMQKPGHTPHYYMPDAQFIGNAQWHALMPIDLSFNPAIPARLCRYSDAELFGFVKAVKSVRGAVTINVPIDQQRGLIPADSHAQLVRLRHFLDAQK